MTHGKHAAPVKTSRTRLVFSSVFPTSMDNPRQLTLKIFFLFCIIAIIIISIVIASYTSTLSVQKRTVNKSLEIWYDTTKTHKEKTELLMAQNSDFSGWLTVANSNIDLPVYQSSDDSFYKTHNLLKRKSRYGALHLDAKDVYGSEKDGNIVITGNNMSDGTMFNNLEYYRRLSFYKENPTVTFWGVEGAEKYVVFAVFLIDGNATAGEDFFNPKYSDFFDETSFNDWVSDAFGRSIINTKINVSYTDRLLTLITDTDDFRNSQLVVMARKVREGETVNTSVAVANAAPKYPHAWYEKKGLKIPY